jgi:hypothetical protein
MLAALFHETYGITIKFKYQLRRDGDLAHFGQMLQNQLKKWIGNQKEI